MIAKTTVLFLLIFVCVLAALDAGAYAFMQREYASVLGPALGTPEGASGLASAMRAVVWTLLAFNAPLIVIVGAASYAMARLTIAPLDAARERERVFAADAAHELRSPLTAIASVAQASRNQLPPDSTQAFDTITHEALEASALISDLLTLARNPGRAVLQCEPVDLGQVVSTCARDVASAANACNVRIDAAPESAIVDGDERRLRELARNLLENAVRHARNRVSIASTSNGRTCSIVVEDDGEGVAPEDRERVFERFYRRAQDASGTGLGLAIVRWIANAHEGTVSVDGAPGGGARFVATLPAHTQA